MSVDQVTNSSATENIGPDSGGGALSETKIRQVCKFYSAGRFCRFGKRCRNLHEKPRAKEVERELSSKEPGNRQDETVKKEVKKEEAPPSVETLSNTEKPRNQQRRKVCNFFLEYGHCRYGSNCRYEHEEPQPSRGRVFRGNRGRNRVRQRSEQEDVEDEKENIADLPAPSEDIVEDNYVGLDSKDTRTKDKAKQRRRQVCRYFRNGYCAMGRRCRFLHERNVQGKDDDVPAQPGMIDLPPKSSRQRIPVPQPPVRPVIPVTDYVIEEMDDAQQAKLRETEITLLKKRIPGDKLEELDDGEFKVTFNPSDPDWPYDVKELHFMVYFPMSYPLNVMQVKIPEEQAMPYTVLSYIEYQMGEWVEKQFNEKKASGKVTLIFRPFLRWLDKVLETLFTEGLKQLKKEIAALGSGIECVPFWKLRAGKKVWKYEPESESNSEDEEETESGSEETESDSESDSNDERERANQNAASISDPVKKGTQIKMRSLQLIEGIGTITCMKIKIVVHCSRCKENCDVKLSSNRAVGTTCTKCNHSLLINYRPAMMHQMSHTVGYLDLDGCKATDVVLMDSFFDLVCLSCSKTMVIKGIQPGSVKNLWCQGCHQKISLAVESTHFQELQQAAIDTSNIQVIRKKRRSMKDPTIQEGMPLPNFGTCKHYKKSFRWLRFPCCGKAYPCDVCHDSNEDHEMTFANRMICGFCSKEQGYAGERPCISCQSAMTKSTKTCHWEGGQGCRDKIKMSKNDSQKYANTNKTVSKKSQHKGTKRPKTTKLRHA